MNTITKAVLSHDRNGIYIHISTPEPTIVFISTDANHHGKAENPLLEQYFNQEGDWINVLHAILNIALAMLSEQVSNTLTNELHFAINEERVYYLDDIGIDVYEATQEEIEFATNFLNAADPYLFLKQKVSLDVKKMISLANTISSARLFSHPNYLDYSSAFDDYTEQFS
jgi:hypothetical protein